MPALARQALPLSASFLFGALTQRVSGPEGASPVLVARKRNFARFLFAPTLRTLGRPRTRSRGVFGTLIVTSASSLVWKPSLTRTLSEYGEASRSRSCGFATRISPVLDP